MAPAVEALGLPKRRTLLIEKAFQLRFITKMMAVVVAGTAIMGTLLYFLADREFGRAFYTAHYQVRSSWELLLPAVLVASAAAMCFVAAVVMAITLYDSHRIGGPLYRFRENLRVIGDGDLTLETRLREGDELQALTETMNAMTRGLRERLLSVRQGQEELRAGLSAVRLKLDEVGRIDAADLRPLDGAEARIRAALGSFKV